MIVARYSINGIEYAIQQVGTTTFKVMGVSQEFTTLAEATTALYGFARSNLLEHRADMQTRIEIINQHLSALTMEEGLKRFKNEDIHS